MIPYFAFHTIQLGPLTLQVWGFFAALGVIVASWFAIREAKKRGLDVAAYEKLVFRIVVASFVGARLGHVLFYEPMTYLAEPLEILKVWHGGYSSFGGFAGAAIAFFLSTKKTWLTQADPLVKALPLGLGCGRIGCFLIHDHPGTMAHGFGQWFAVNYPDGPRYDLGLLLGVLDALIFGLFLIMMRKPRPDGFYFALFMTVYGPTRFLLDFLRVVDSRYLGLTPAQFGSLALTAAGLYLFSVLFRQGGRSWKKSSAPASIVT